MNTATAFDQLTFIMAYENGELSPLEIVEGFAELIKSGIVWQLQGSYGRAAAAMIESGYITTAGELTGMIDDLES